MSIALHNFPDRDNIRWIYLLNRLISIRVGAVSPVPDRRANIHNGDTVSFI